MRSRGRSVRGKVAILSSRDLGVLPCFSSRRVDSAGKALRARSYLFDAPSTARVSGAACCVCRPKSSGGSCVGVVAPGGYVRAGACCCPWSRLGPPVCGLPEAIWREATVDTRAWMLAMMAWRYGVGASASLLAPSVPSYSSSYSSESWYSSAPLLLFVWGRCPLPTVAGRPVGVDMVTG